MITSFCRTTDLETQTCLSSPYKLSVPVPRTCTCTFLRVTAGSKRTSVQRTSVPSVETLPAETRRKPVPACTGYLYFVPVLVPLPGTCTSYVPRTCTCIYTSYPYLHVVPRMGMGRLMWQEGLSAERRTCNFNLQSVRGTEKKVKVRYSAFTIRNLNPYESKVFTSFCRTTDL